MNERLAKLAILGGFGLKALASVFSLFTNLFNTADTYMSTAETVAPISIFSGFISLIGILGTLAIVGGFAMLFLLGPNILDLVIGGGIAVTLVSPFLPSILIYSLALPAQVYSLVATFINIIYITAMLAWAFKMRQSGLPLAVMAIVIGVGLSFGGGYVTVLTQNTIINNLSTIASNGALAFAAFTYYRS